MVFPIIVNSGALQFMLMVTLIESGSSYELFKVHPKNNPDKFVVIQCNRPMLRNRLKLMHKKLTWVLKSGEIKDKANYNRLIKAIENILEPPPPKRKSPTLKSTNSQPPNRKKSPKRGIALRERGKGSAG